MNSTAVRFSLQFFGPILVLLLPPAMILLPFAGLSALAAAFDPITAFSRVIPLLVWSWIPLLLGIGSVLCGAWIYRSQKPHFVAISTLSGFFFLAIWLDLTLLGAISASDKPPLEYLVTTAGLAAAATLLAQLAITPWARYTFDQFPFVGREG